MQCHVCGANTRVIKTREIAAGTVITRRRTCDASPPHSFTTQESMPSVSLDQVKVRQSGDGKLHAGVFQRSKIYDSATEGALERLTAEQIDAAIDEGTADLQRQLPTLLKPFLEHDHHDKVARGWIWDGNVTDAMEAALERRDRMAAVLYALVARGRHDREGRTGWRDASGVLEWLPTRFPHVDTRVAPGRAMPTQRWYPPADPPRPTAVIKRFSNEGDARLTPLYDHQIFLESIQKALAGRVTAKTASEAARSVETQSALIADWVLWGVAGQPVVLTSQLATGVLDALRRFDDVAYLNWVCVAKRISTVTEFAAEVRSLIEHPSPRLKFDPAVLASPHLYDLAKAEPASLETSS